MRYRFQFCRYRLPFRTAVRTAHGVWTEREGVIVRLDLHEKQGVGGKQQEGQSVRGYGEAAPVPGFGLESVDEIEAACREIGEWVEEERLWEAARGWPCLRNAVSAAVAEVNSGCRLPNGGRQGVAGRGEKSEVRTQKPEVAAETRPRARSATGGRALGVAALLSAGKAAVAQIEPKAEMGFRVFKWKVGVGEVADELALLDDVCAALPSGAKLRLDANGAWDRRKAERWLERCAERPVEFVEQPVAADAKGARDLLLGLAGDFPTKIALDESLVGDGDVEQWLGAGWPGILVVKLSLLGDAAGAIARLEVARADVVFSSALETAIGTRRSLRVAFAWAQKREEEHHQWTQMNTNAEQVGGARRPSGPPPPPIRALGFGVYPLFLDSRFDGPPGVPFFREAEVERINSDAVWNALWETK